MSTSEHEQLRLDGAADGEAQGGDAGSPYRPGRIKRDAPDRNGDASRNDRIVLVCGSTSWTDARPIHDRLVQLPRGVCVIHGAARGADLIAAAICRSLGIDEEGYPADWRVKADTPAARIRRRRDGTLYDVAAGIFRNLELLDMRPGRVLAFQRNGSSGTQHVIDEARRRGVPVELFAA